MSHTVEVDREALRKILNAVALFSGGDTDGIKELVAVASGDNSPLMQVIRDFNSSVAYQTITDGLFGGEE